MQGIYNYVPETNNVSMVYNVAAILQLQFKLHGMLFLMSNVWYFLNDLYFIIIIIIIATCNHLLYKYISEVVLKMT